MLEYYKGCGDQEGNYATYDITDQKLWKLWINGKEAPLKGNMNIFSDVHWLGNKISKEELLKAIQ